MYSVRDDIVHEGMDILICHFVFAKFVLWWCLTPLLL